MRRTFGLLLLLRIGGRPLGTQSPGLACVAYWLLLAPIPTSVLVRYVLYPLYCRKQHEYLKITVTNYASLNRWVQSDTDRDGAKYNTLPWPLGKTVYFPDDETLRVCAFQVCKSTIDLSTLCFLLSRSPAAQRWATTTVLSSVQETRIPSVINIGKIRPPSTPSWSSP